MLLTLNFQYCFIKNPHFRVAKMIFFFTLCTSCAFVLSSQANSVWGEKREKNKILVFFSQTKAERVGLAMKVVY